MEGNTGEEDTKICSNCKRDIPIVNFLVHSVHCARNIRPCATCKEPVPLSDLQDHHDRLHKLQPCKACGERVCGSDLEDHVRDSCGNTVRPCRFCELELPRKKLPNHESYCGSRTEQCPECQEWVQIKYRQLHLDSNHGFIKLDDEPPPIPQLLRPATSRPTSGANWSQQPSTQPSTTNQPQTNTARAQLYTTKPSPNGSAINGLTNAMKQINLQNDLLRPVPNTSTSNFQPLRLKNEVQSSSNGALRGDSLVPNGLVQNDGPSNVRGDLGVRPKRNNNQPQVNTAVAGASKVSKDSSLHGAIKKRPAPKPPTQCPQRDNALRSALARHREEEAERRDLNAKNAAMGLPPVLSAAEKLEKLRKMDALQNRETEVNDYSPRLRGQCWTTPDFAPQTYVLGHDGHGNNPRELGNSSRDVGNCGDVGNNGVDVGNNGRDQARTAGDMDRRSDRELEQTRWIQVPRASPSSPHPSPTGARATDNTADRRHDLKDLKPMTQAEFLDRFQEIHEGRRGEGCGRRGEGEDRFSEIKFSLRELRRGLNEVTAPYNISGSPNNNGSAGVVRRPSVAATCDDDVRLPCEFCDVLVPREDLVLHQTGCRPDLVAYSPRPSPARSPSPLPAAGLSRTELSRTEYADPVIPCEFCAESLPVYLINEHQERCRRENDQLYLD